MRTYTPFLLSSRFYFSRLTRSEQGIYRRIYDCWHAGGCEASFLLPGAQFGTGAGKRTVFDIASYIIADNPHLFHLESTHTFAARQGDTVTVRCNPVYTPEEYADIYAELNAAVDDLLRPVKAADSELSKLRYLHDRLVTEITYKTGNGILRSDREVHTIVGALLNRACVCDGYARAFRLLCDRLHLSCMVVLGNSVKTAVSPSGGHAWNMVKIGGIPYQVDLTWDSNSCAGEARVSDFWFLRSDNAFSSTHRWNRQLYPACPYAQPSHYVLCRDTGTLERYLTALVGRRRTGDGGVFLVGFSPADPPAEAGRLIQQIMNRNLRIFSGVRFHYSLVYAPNAGAELLFRWSGGEPKAF